MTTEIEICKVLECLAPWIEKTNGEESIGSWETTLATKMMVKPMVRNLLVLGKPLWLLR